MPSRIAEAPRRIPQQLRGERRVAQLLRAAGAEIAAVGYEAATMSAIAGRARAPIGSLYQFFPNKVAITHALRTEYGKDYEALLAALELEAGNLSLDRLVARLVNVSLHFVESRPAFLPLLDAPSSTRSPLSLRRRLRSRLARCFGAVHPGLQRARALRFAAVTLQMMKGLNQLYGEASPPEKRHLVCEYRIALSGYLHARIGNGKTPR